MSRSLLLRSKFVKVGLLFFVFSFSLLAQAEKEPRLSSEPLNLVDMPTAGILYHRNLATALEFLDQGGMIVSAQTGLFDRVMVGLAYGGTNVIGVEKTMFNPHIGALVRVRLVEESYYVPAVAFGFSSQGKGAYLNSLNRYATKSTGFYAVASKNFEALGYLSIHAGMYYSLEDADNRTLNFFAGVEKTFATIFSGIIEYDNGVALAKSASVDKGRGLLNLGLRATIGNGFRLGLNLKDLVKNRQDVSVGDRTILIEYARVF